MVAYMKTVRIVNLRSRARAFKSHTLIIVFERTVRFAVFNVWHSTSRSVHLVYRSCVQFSCDWKVHEFLEHLKANFPVVVSILRWWHVVVVFQVMLTTTTTKNKKVTNRVNDELFNLKQTDDIAATTTHYYYYCYYYYCYYYYYYYYYYHY